MPVRAVLPRELGCESESDDSLRVLETALRLAVQVADTYGQDLRLSVTLTGASSFSKPEVHCHKALDKV